MAFERTLVAIRERPLGDVLDLALVVARARPGALGLAAVAGIGPFVALNHWIFAGLAAGSEGWSLVLWAAEAPFATAPMTCVLGDLMFGRAPGPGRTAARLARSAIGLAIVQGILRWVPIASWPAPRLAFGNELVLLERCRWWRVPARGGDLARGREATIAALVALEWAVAPLLATAWYLASGRVGQVLLSEPMGWEFPGPAAWVGLRFQGALWAGAAFFAVARFLAYIDQRIRREGWAIELRLRDVAGGMAGAGRW